MTMEEKFEKGLAELVTLGMEGGLHPYQMTEIMLKEIKRMHEDHEASQR